MKYMAKISLIGLVLYMIATVALAEVGVSDEKIVIGESAPFAGQSGELGVGLSLGATVFFTALNEQGGIAGRKVELLKDDDNNEPGMAVLSTINFIEKDKVFALFGYVGTESANAVLPIVNKAKIPFFAPLTGAPSLRMPANPYVFNIRASIFDETEKIVEQLATTGIKTISVFYQNDADGLAGLEGIKKALRRFKTVELLDSIGVARNTMEIGDAGTKLAAKRPKAIIQICSYTSSANLIKKMREQGYQGGFYNVSFVGSRAISRILGGGGRGVVIAEVVPSPWDSQLAIVREYQKAMRKAEQKDYDFASLEGYIAAKTFSVIARKVGRDLTREKFISTAEAMGRIDLGDFWITFTPESHSGSQFVELVIIGENGRFLH